MPPRKRKGTVVLEDRSDFSDQVVAILSKLSPAEKDVLERLGSLPVIEQADLLERLKARAKEWMAVEKKLEQQGIDPITLAGLGARKPRGKSRA